MYGDGSNWDILRLLTIRIIRANVSTAVGEELSRHGQKSARVWDILKAPVWHRQPHYFPGSIQ